MYSCCSEVWKTRKVMRVSTRCEFSVCSEIENSVIFIFYHHLLFSGWLFLRGMTNRLFSEPGNGVTAGQKKKKYELCNRSVYPASLACNIPSRNIFKINEGIFIIHFISLSSNTDSTEYNCSTDGSFGRWPI